jgi:D-alanyl-D-alanine dipeptidase
MRYPALLLVLFLAAPPLRAADPGDLVDVQSVCPQLRIDLPYATPDNFTKQVVYRVKRCYLRRFAAERLSAVQTDLETMGLGLKVWDGYRPLSVQKQFWALVPDERYVASPAKGSRHNRGAAVDVTLVDRTGTELEMPTKFDDFTEAAAANAPCSQVAAENRKLLQRVMKKHGFQILPTEWWHFDAVDWEKYEVLDVSFDKLGTTPSKPGG